MRLDRSVRGSYIERYVPSRAHPCMPIREPPVPSCIPRTHKPTRLSRSLHTLVPACLLKLAAVTGTFTLDGKSYSLHQNDGTSTLHGGALGWDRRPWKRLSSSSSSVTYEIVDESWEGFPGVVTARVRPSLVWTGHGGRNLRVDAHTGNI